MNEEPNELSSAGGPAEHPWWSPDALSTVKRYGVAVLSVLIAFAIRYWLSPVLGEELPFMLFVAASLLAAWYGGAATGIVALLLGMLVASYFFLPARPPAHPPLSLEAVQFVRYFFTASLGIVLIEVLHRDRRRTRAALRELQSEVERRQRIEAALREAQGQLRQRAEELEERVAERTLRLAATVEYLRGLLYSIAHNLRAPLRAMEGFSTLLASECATALPASAHEHLGHIAEAAKRMDELIQDLLDYGRLGHMDVTLSKLSLQHSVDRVLLRLAYEIKTRHAEVVVQGPLPEVQAHPEVLEQVLANLLENALQFVAPGVAPRVRIWADSSGAMVRLWVEDNGIGIPAQYHERIFGVFESLAPGQGEGGTGIGLAIVKQGMQRLGGRVGVESQPGAGSRFWVEFKAGE